MTHSALLYDGEPLPFAYRWLVERGLIQFGPWFFIEEQAASDAFCAEFAKEVADPNPSPVKGFQPFAQHAACDDFAGFVIRDGRLTKEVVCVHLTFAGRTELPGFPGLMVYEDIWNWLADCVIPEMRIVAERFEEHELRFRE